MRSFRVYLALILGCSFGLLLYSFFLVDYFPPTSKQIIFYTVLASLIGSIGYYLLLDLCIVPLLFRMTKASRWGIVIGSILIGVYLALAYLNIQGSPPRYINFLLPREHLEISVPASTGASDAKIVIHGFTTSLGDVSYNALDFEGWSRNGYNLSLIKPSNNTVEWSGRTGDQAVITFQASLPGAVVNVSWNGENELLQIPSAGDGNYQYTHDFTVPLYASRTLLLLLGASNFFVVCCAVNLLIWKNRIVILSSLEQSVSALLRPTRGEVVTSGEGNSAGQHILRREWLVISCLMSLALLLRVFNLDNLYPYSDEYSHLWAAKSILRGDLNSVFDRSLLIVTVPVVVSLRIFGTELWAARLPGVLFNALAIIPLYLLTRKINKPVAVLSGLLYASSPLIIGLARNVREYAYYPFYFYWIVYGIIMFLERCPDRLVLFKDWKILFRPDLRILSLALAIVPIYAVFVDPRSTFKIILVAYGVFGIFLLSKFDLKNKANTLSLILIGISLVVAAGVYSQEFGFWNLSVIPRFHTESLSTFFPSPEEQWYFDRPALIPAFALLLAGVICVRTIRSNLVPSFLGVLFLACALFFTTFFGHYFKPRYMTIMQLWFVALLALGLYGLFALQLILPRKEIILPLTATALFALTINISQTLLPTFYDKQGNMPITLEYHYNMGPAQTFLLDKVKPQDVLISSVYESYVRWEGAPTFKDIFSYSFVIASLQYKWIFPYESARVVMDKPRDFVLSIVEENNSGWIVLDSVTYFSTVAKPLPLKTTVINNKEIDYLGYFGGEYIWKWHVIPPSS